MKKQIILSLLAAVAVQNSYCKDINLEQYVKKYWTAYQNKKLEVGNGDKRWPVTPDLKAERLRHFVAMLNRFAPHQVEEAYQIDRIFGWEKGTYLGLLRFGAKKVEVKPEKINPSHECTSWITMDNMTGGKEIIMHKNRDTKKRLLTIQRRALPGKHAWIGSGSCYSFYPAQGINDRGVVVLMNSGDAHVESENSQYGLSTGIICRILLEECGTAEAAVEMLGKIVADNAYTHVECGSIWFIGDYKNVYIVEQNARKFVSKAVNSGFIARANAFHYPETQISSLRSCKSLIAHSRREFSVRDFLVNTQWRKNGVITPLDIAASSRIDKVDGDPKCYPPCGKSTISGTTFVIDKEYPEFLSSVYAALSSPASSCYLPIPMTLKEVPEEICNGSYSDRSLKLMEKKLPLLPADKLAVLEKRLYERHQAAVEKARVLLRTSTKHTVKDDVAKILNDAFAENFKDLQSSVK
ncbi:MAG: hypothetical protein E7039_00490 [Lentisphaerae bacterium]|nr:hypothetical protein [Lentisphaerota bacterium]